MADELVGDEMVNAVEQWLIDNPPLTNAALRSEIARLKAELAAAREWTTGGTRWINEQEYDRVCNLLAEARGKALEEAANICGAAAHNVCLDAMRIRYGDEASEHARDHLEFAERAIRDLARPQ